MEKSHPVGAQIFFDKFRQLSGVRISTSFEYIVDTSGKTASWISERIEDQLEVFCIFYAFSFISFFLETFADFLLLFLCTLNILKQNVCSEEMLKVTWLAMVLQFARAIISQELFHVEGSFQSLNNGPWCL